ncbi:MAG: VOC family protein, partial [Pseudomonadota bacterium]
VSFGVESEEQLWELKDRLTAAGFPVSGVIDHGFIRSIYSWDPNGLPIEFSADVPGVDIRRTPQMRDESPTSVSEEGPDPIEGRWPRVEKPTPPDKRRVFPGAGSELFHGTRSE